MPTVLRMHGHRFFFLSNEGREQPHIHIATAEKYVKFWLNPVALDRSVGYNVSEVTKLRELVIEHCEFLKEKWHEHFGW